MTSVAEAIELMKQAIEKFESSLPANDPAPARGGKLVSFPARLIVGELELIDRVAETHGLSRDAVLGHAVHYWFEGLKNKNPRAEIKKEKADG